MFFDKLAHAAENDFPQWREAVEDSRLFRIHKAEPAKPSEYRLSEWEPDEKVIENCRLPFKSVAIEEGIDRHSSTSNFCVILSRGVTDDRHYDFKMIFTLDRQSLLASGRAIFLPDADPENKQGRMSRILKLQIWEQRRKKWERVDTDERAIECNNDRHTVGFEKVSAAIEVGKGRSYWKPGENIDIDELKAILGDDMPTRDECDKMIADTKANMAHAYLGKALFYLLVINSPATFIVKESVVDEMAKDKTEHRIVRGHKRDHFILLKPNEIRTKMGVSEPDGSERAAHERRGHWRRLLSEKFSEGKRGSTIWIKACFIGPREAIVGKKRYEVMLDI